ncbi:hypothetical protein ZIOFF_043541 [Zingiber officinale]|uniref:Uncharacterized protein n=1 Tax=Zingiber officinale TaxID=94328 RepID=A0A8J5KYX2_ZINOF|nr:hypothetical protein ZIOFF_043541 [Zingiber officinale]
MGTLCLWKYINTWAIMILLEMVSFFLFYTRIILFVVNSLSSFKMKYLNLFFLKDHHYFFSVLMYL